MANVRFVLFGLILLFYLVAGSLYAGLTPNWQAPDEPAHYNYIRYLATQSGFPELVIGCYDQAYLSELTSRRFPPELPVEGICYEFHQPPLYYLLATPIFWLSDGSLLALRLFSVVLGAGVVVLAFLVGQTIFPHRLEIVFGAMAFVAFVPMHVTILASVNNDALAELIFAAILLMLVRRLIRVDSNHLSVTSNRSSIDGSRITGHRSLITANCSLGILLGLGLVTKMTVYIAIPLVALTLWLVSSKEVSQNRRSRDWASLIKQAALIFGLALVIALPWYIRNVVLYGEFDVLGLARHDAVVVGQLRTVDYLAKVGWGAYFGEFITTTFRSFWGQFGWMAVPMDGRTYQLLTVLTVVALGGLIGFWILNLRHLPCGLTGDGVKNDFCTPYKIIAEQRRALGLIALAIGLTFLAYIWYNLSFKQLQGRYLFPAIIPLGLFFALGLQEALSWQWRWWVVAGLGVVLAWVGTASVLSGGLDKWGVLVVGLALGLAVGRALFARFWFVPTTWLVILCLGGVALLALFSPFWFVLPNLAL